ncbi:glycosyltransferase, partial [bacterium]
YREEKIIADTLKNYPIELKEKYNLELIVSDGGSDDKTLEFLGDNVDKIIRHNSEKRQTIAEGRNKGAEVAEGEILFFINADTFPENINYILGRLLNWENDGELKNLDAIATKVLPFASETDRKDTIFYSLLNKYFKFLNQIGIGMGRGECQIIKKSTFIKVKGYNDKIVAGEDFDLYRRIAKIGNVKFIDKFVVFESPRRFKQEGYISTLTKWFLNSVSVLFLGKSYSKVWKAIR